MLIIFWQMLEVAEAIQYLHSEGIVHGDLHGVGIELDIVSSKFLINSFHHLSEEYPP